MRYCLFSTLRLALLASLSLIPRLRAADIAPARASEMSFLDNGKVRVGVDLKLGGAITWLSRSGGENA